jgi:hypothetical protein
VNELPLPVSLLSVPIVCQAKKLSETLTLKVGEKLSLEDLRLDLEGVSALDSDPELQYIIPFNDCDLSFG